MLLFMYHLSYQVNNCSRQNDRLTATNPCELHVFLSSNTPRSTSLFIKRHVWHVVRHPGKKWAIFIPQPWHTPPYFCVLSWVASRRVLLRVWDMGGVRDDGCRRMPYLPSNAARARNTSQQPLPSGFRYPTAVTCSQTLLHVLDV